MIRGIGYEGAESKAALRSTRAARTFVWGVRLALLLVALVGFVAYSRNISAAEDKRPASTAPNLGVGSALNAVSTSGQPLVTQQIRYYMAEASEIVLVWGSNGWAVVPEELRPSGTVIKDGLMHTPMNREGASFVVKVQVPAGSKLEYGFRVTMSYNGISNAQTWDGSNSYQFVAREDGIVEVKPTLRSSQDQTSTLLTAAPLVNQEIRYQLAEAGEVFLVWGINGWAALPVEMRPAGTVLQGKLMYMPMSLVDGVFVAKVQVPADATIDYAFQITQNRAGLSVNAWDMNGSSKQDYHTIAQQGGVTEVKSALTLTPGGGVANSIWGRLQAARGALFFIGIGIVLSFGAARSRAVRSALHRSFNLVRHWGLQAAVFDTEGRTLKRPALPKGWGSAFSRIFMPIHSRVILKGLEYVRSDIAKVALFAIASRVLLLIFAWLAVTLYTNKTDLNIDLNFANFKQGLSSVKYADVDWYINIAQNGYEQRSFSDDKQANWAFYPLWPIVMRLGNTLVSDIVLMGVLLSSLLFVISAVYLYRLLLLDFNKSISMTAVILMVIFPASYFCFRPGPESLFLLLVVTSFFYARREQWFLAGVLGAAAVLTRPQGLFLFPALIYVYYEQYTKSRKHDFKAVSLVLVPFALFSFMAYLYLLTGNFFANIDIQNAWDHHSSYPLASIIDYFYKPRLVSYYGYDLSVVNFIFACLSVIAIVIAVRKPAIPRSYIINMILNVYIIVSRDTLEGSLRFLIPIFPLYIIISQWIHERKLAYNMIFFTFTTLQVFYFVAFILQYNWAAN